MDMISVIFNQNYVLLSIGSCSLIYKDLCPGRYIMGDARSCRTWTFIQASMSSLNNARKSKALAVNCNKLHFKPVVSNRIIKFKYYNTGETTLCVYKQ